MYNKYIVTKSRSYHNFVVIFLHIVFIFRQNSSKKIHYNISMLTSKSLERSYYYIFLYSKFIKKNPKTKTVCLKVNFH